MRCSNLIVLVVLAGLWLPPMACINPADEWAAGVLWNNGEAVNFTMIDSLGDSGVNFIKKQDSTGMVQYFFRSKYAPNQMMTYLGYFPFSFQGNAPRLVMVLDTTAHMDEFDFSEAVYRELEFLSNIGIINLSILERETIRDSLKIVVVDHGNAQYWTLQKRVLAYNTWFDYDSVKKEWDMIGIKGFYGCGLDLAFVLPPQELTGSTAFESTTRPALSLSSPGINVSPNPFQSTTAIIFSDGIIGTDVLQIIDLSGSVIRSFTGKSMKSVLWDGTDCNGHQAPNGCYIVRLTAFGRQYQEKVLLLK